MNLEEATGLAISSLEKFDVGTIEKQCEQQISEPCSEVIPAVPDPMPVQSSGEKQISEQLVTAVPEHFQAKPMPTISGQHSNCTFNFNFNH